MSYLLCLVILALCWALVRTVRKLEVMYRTYLRRSYLLHPKHKVRQVPLTDVDACFSVGTLETQRGPELQLLGGSGFGSPTLEETWILTMLARQSQAMFEFGTCTGRTTYLWARNSRPEARITTLTLHPSALDSYQPAAQDFAQDTSYALQESRFDSFYYSGTDVAYKIRQLFGDSKVFDETAYEDQFDLIFVDGSHAYSYVASDSAKALKMLRPGGLLLWHDYLGPCHVQGVFRFLNELCQQLPIRWISGTSLVFYRKPSDVACRQASAA